MTRTKIVIMILEDNERSSVPEEGHSATEKIKVGELKSAGIHSKSELRRIIIIYTQSSF